LIYSERKILRNKQKDEKPNTTAIAMFSCMSSTVLMACGMEGVITLER
jgi:hypothetical protein